jgi:hypothetical protein
MDVWCAKVCIEGLMAENMMIRRLMENNTYKRGCDSWNDRQSTYVPATISEFASAS